MAQLALHLRLQDFSPQQITILACYAGQFFLLRNMLKEHPLTNGIPVKVPQFTSLRKD